MSHDKGQAGAVLRSSPVQAALEVVVKNFGVDHATFHLTANVRAGIDNPFVRTTYPSAWVSSYLLNNFVAIDPIVQHGMKADCGFSWAEVPITPVQMAMLRAAREFGLGDQGYTVPITDEMRRRSLLSLNCRRPADEWVEFLKTHSAEIKELAKVLHLEAVTEATVGQAELQLLSPREQQCLRWTAEGKTHTEIAITLDLSAHTVRSYLKVVRLKLDSVSIAQAVVKATNLGLI